MTHSIKVKLFCYHCGLMAGLLVLDTEAHDDYWICDQCDNKMSLSQLLSDPLNSKFGGS